MNMNNTTKIQTLSLSLILLMAAMTTMNIQTSSIFADDDNDDIEKGEVGEKGEIIAKLVSSDVVEKDDDVNDNKNVIPVVQVPKIIPEVEAQQQQQIKTPPPQEQPQQEEQNNDQEDKGMKLVLGDIVLPISQASNFSLELPFSKITVEPVVK
jgi:hypothetical protein